MLQGGGCKGFVELQVGACTGSVECYKWVTAQGL